MASKNSLQASLEVAAKDYVSRHKQAVTVLVLGFGVGVVGGAVLNLTGVGAFLLGCLLAGVFSLLRPSVVHRKWIKNRRRLLAKASLPSPDAKQLRKDHKSEKARIKHVQTQWPVFCEVNRVLGKGKVAPGLYKLRANVEGDIIGLVTCGPLGVSPSKVAGLADEIRSTVGCTEVLPRFIGTGSVELSFLWTEAMERTVPVAELASAKTGEIAYGVRRDGSTASITAGLSVMIGGMTGSGKSGITWSLLADCNRQKLRVNLYASDPKGGIELAALGRNKDEDRAYTNVSGYVTSSEETAGLIEQVEAVMKERQANQTGRKWTTKDSDDLPLIILLIDESIEVMADLQTAGPSNNRTMYLKKLKTIISQGRASGVMVIALTQMGQKGVMGDVRDMFAQRLCLATRNSISTDMILGDEAEKLGANCSTIINRPGLGYSYDETRRGYELFRAAWVDDDDIEKVAAGEVPDGMGMVRGKLPVARECGVYCLFTTDMQSVYVGKGFKPQDRWDDHAGKSGKPQKWWWQYVDMSKSVVKWAESETAALDLEEREIKRLLPFGNTQHNLDNPLKGRGPGVAAAFLEPKPAPVETPDEPPVTVLEPGQVIPITRQPEPENMISQLRYARSHR